MCHSFWALQFHALRAVFCGRDTRGQDMRAAYRAALEETESYVHSLASSAAWDARGGKSGARFFRTRCGRFVVKFVSRTELQMFNEVAPAYFEYMAKAVFQQVPSALVKILGVYQLGYHNRQTGKRCMEQAVVMQNLFYDRNITKVFDLKGSTRSRYVHVNPEESVDDSSRPGEAGAPARPRPHRLPHGRAERLALPLAHQRHRLLYPGGH